MAAVVVAGAVVATVALWPDGSGGGSGSASDGGSAKPSAESSSPSVAYPVSKAPRTIPSVRNHEAARGPGWKPSDDGRVLVSDPGLADEGKLLARELKLRYAGKGGARQGDVELALTSGGGGSEKAGAESYTMTVREGRVRITGRAQAGVFYGTRTLKQSVRADGVMPEGVVRDEPAKPQRGFMLDIARKPYDAGWIEDRVRELADLKYNQLGLHFSDDQGFRIASDSHPEIVSREHLTKAQVRSIVKLATGLHITVIPEIDSPGHLGAVIAAHPGLQLKNTSGAATRGAVDISEAEAGSIVDDLTREYVKLFPGAYWNLGADEYQALVVSHPEASFPQLAAAARKKYGQGATIKDLAMSWLNDRADAVREADPKRVVKAWNDGFFAGGAVKGDKDVEVGYWTGKEIGARGPEEYLREGREVLNYNDEYMYYVLGQPNTFTYPTGQRIYEQWTPRVIRGTKAVPASYDKLILGGSFAVWGDLAQAQTQDQVADGIRMPLRATVEKLWNPDKPTLSWAEFVSLAKRTG
ncbi:beta-N-acetylhexosaminidase [Streptomyces tsukubensis]|uniref:beta-N-acetylhexosaminidase n=1 Tax=Streptomyces tsukubensis TaxID=83656 RepID=UPI00351D029C